MAFSTRYEMVNEPKQQQVFAEVMQERYHVQLVLQDTCRG
jgi:hypothetical protein